MRKALNRWVDVWMQRFALRRALVSLVSLLLYVERCVISSPSTVSRSCVDWNAELGNDEGPQPIRESVTSSALRVTLRGRP